jgi:hypothetical protein
MGGAAQRHLGLDSRPLALTGAAGTAATPPAYNRQVLDGIWELP